MTRTSSWSHLGSSTVLYFTQLSNPQFSVGMFPCTLQVPLVKLDDKYFKLVDQMERLTPRPPSLVAAKSLIVKVCGGHVGQDGSVSCSVRCVSFPIVKHTLPLQPCVG
jgi:hypothetical protein